MTANDLLSLLPIVVLAVGAAVIMLVIAFRRDHFIAAWLTLASLLLALASLPTAASVAPRQVTALMVVDGQALFFSALILAASFVVTVLAYGYLSRGQGQREEFYVMLLLATLGSVVLVGSSHFSSFFLGLEILGISLYVLIAYTRGRETSIEAGVKYLVLAAVSGAFLLFGMALVYAEVGTMEFARLAAMSGLEPVTSRVLLLMGLAMIVAGVGFKLAVVPFHMWTPDVYQGAPAPVTAFVATASKGAVFALLLRYFSQVEVHQYPSLFVAFAAVAIASMLVGNLLALLQSNVKRILAYSSIAHLGYLLVAFLAEGAFAYTAIAFYLIAYFVATLGAFGVVSELSNPNREADTLDEYRGLIWRRPWLAGVLTAMLLSLAGIPLTVGFIGKFYIVTAGLESALWWLLVALVVGSVIGLYYYLRVAVTMFLPHQSDSLPMAPVRAESVSVVASLLLVILALIAIWLGVYPTAVIDVIQTSLAETV